MQQHFLLNATNFNEDYMNYKKAFGTIELLLGMVVMAAIFVMLMPSMQGIDSKNYTKSSLKNPNEAVQKANELSKEIERLRRAPIDLNGSLN